MGPIHRQLGESVSYSVYKNGQAFTVPQGQTTYTIDWLSPGATSYTFTVQARDAGDKTATSNAVSLTTEATSDVTPPSAPANVRIVEDQGCGEVWVGWTQSTDDTDPQSAIEYEIYVNGVLSPLPVGAGIDRDFVYATAQGDNTFVVKAVDRSGNTSEASNAATAVLWPC